MSEDLLNYLQPAGTYSGNQEAESAPDLEDYLGGTQTLPDLADLSAYSEEEAELHRRAAGVLAAQLRGGDEGFSGSEASSRSDRDDAWHENGSPDEMPLHGKGHETADLETARRTARTRRLEVASAGRKKLRPLNSFEVATICEQLSILFESGITPVESITILIKDSRKAEEAELLQQILDYLLAGEPFADALSRTCVFPEYVVELIAVGHETGKLDIVTRSLAEYYDEEHNLKQNLKSAVSYPLVMIVMMAVVILVLLRFVLPVFEQVFEQLGAAMTGLAGSLLSAGQALGRYSTLLGIVFGAAVVLFFYFYATPVGQRQFSRFTAWFPATRKFSERIAVSRFASALQLTQASGVETYSSLELCRSLVGNEVVRNKITKCKELVEDGASFSEALAGSEIFPPFYSSMIDVGARTGRLDRVMGFIGRRYKQETDASIERVVGSIEPTLVIILSVAVGLILLSVILPLMGIMSSIG